MVDPWGLSGVFARAVPVYVVVVATMVLLAGSSSVALARPDVLIGAALFAASDIAVARDRFVEKSFINGAWGLPTYFAAQVVLALSIAS